MSEAVQVWITRADPGAAATADRVQAIGFAPIVAPLLTVRLLDAPIVLDGIAALAFTSMNGIEAFAAGCARRDLAVFTIGDATAKRARRLGFTAVKSADGAMPDLIRLIAAEPPAGAVLHPAARQKAGDLVGGLKRRGVSAHAVDLYETLAVPALPEAVAEALAERTLRAILIHSPRAGEVLADLAGESDLSEVIAFGLSTACLRPLKRLAFEATLAASKPKEDALLDALLRTLGNRAAPR